MPGGVQTRARFRSSIDVKDRRHEENLQVLRNRRRLGLAIRVAIEVPVRGYDKGCSVETVEFVGIAA